MKLSVEISTYNRKHTLKNVLESLARQTYPPDRFEVVVASDGSTDGTGAMLETLAPDLPYPLVYVNHDHKGPGATHNLGVDTARGELVLMLADDIIADPGLLEAHVKSHKAHPGMSEVVSGRLRQSDELQNTLFQRIWNQFVNQLFVGGIDSIRHGMFLVSNLSFKKKFFTDCGMFREWPPASHEDLELGYRMLDHGMRLIHNPEARGYHYHNETLESVSNRAYMQGLHWHYFEKHVPEVWVRKRSENPAPEDGRWGYMALKTKKKIRTLLVNQWFVDHLALPIIGSAEGHPLLAVFTPFLIKRVTGFHFYRGLSDFRKKNGLHLTD